MRGNSYRTVRDFELPDEVILKFGKLQHLEDMLARGRVRFAGANRNHSGSVLRYYDSPRGMTRLYNCLRWISCEDF